ncbi:MAG: hypothetical protein Kow00120_18580 [Anaerolineae bacterium]
MSAENRLRQTLWFFDDTGYYSYVLLNAPEVQFERIQQILKNEGLRVLLAGKSFRPASNGIRYQWYIRISDEMWRHPTRERVNRILGASEVTEAISIVPEPETGRPSERIASQGEVVRTLKATVSQQREEIRRLRVALGEKERQYLDAAQKFRQEITDLESRLAQIQETALNPEDVAGIHQTYESTIQRLRQELEEKDKEHALWISSFEPGPDIISLENQVAILTEEKKRLIDQIHEIGTAREIEPERENPQYLFCETLNILLPNIELLRGSIDALWLMQNPISVLKHLPRLGQLKAERVHRAPDWKKRNFGREWRLYFRKSGDSKYQVLISHKKNQEEDIDWLINQ